MPGSNTDIGPSFNRPAYPTAEDLSSDIAKTVDRRPGDIVRCVRVGDEKYRVNWWCASDATGYDNPGMTGGQIGTTHRIRQSRFLHVTRRSGKIVIEETRLG